MQTEKNLSKADYSNSNIEDMILKFEVSKSNYENSPLSSNGRDFEQSKNEDSNENKNNKKNESSSKYESIKKTISDKFNLCSEEEEKSFKGFEMEEKNIEEIKLDFHDENEKIHVIDDQFSEKNKNKCYSTKNLFDYRVILVNDFYKICDSLKFHLCIRIKSMKNNRMILINNGFKCQELLLKFFKPKNTKEFCIKVYICNQVKFSFGLNQLNFLKISRKFSNFLKKTHLIIRKY